jgi:hypothetical protein
VTSQTGCQTVYATKLRPDSRKQKDSGCTPQLSVQAYRGYPRSFWTLSRENGVRTAPRAAADDD